MKKINNLSLYIYANSSPEIGGGHVLRQFALAQQAQKMGLQVTFIYHHCDASLRSRLKEAGFLTHRLKNFNFNELQQSNLLRADNTNVLIIDDYKLSLAQKVMLTTLPAFVVVFDDKTDQDKIFADMVVNGAERVSSTDYDSRTDASLFLLGSDYRLIRQEFIQARATQFNENPSNKTLNKRLLITLGASDVKQLTLQLVQELLHIDANLPLDIVLGSMAEVDKAPWQKVKLVGKHIALYENVKDMSALMRNAALAISSAGGTLFELACLGVPTIALCVVDNQLPALDASLNHSGYIAFDVSQSEYSDGVVSMLQPVIAKTISLWQQPETRLQMSQYLQQKIDGLGSERIMKAIIHKLENA